MPNPHLCYLDTIKRRVSVENEHIDFSDEICAPKLAPANRHWAYIFKLLYVFVIGWSLNWFFTLCSLYFVLY